jgi:hypothetical protein
VTWYLRALAACQAGLEYASTSGHGGVAHPQVLASDLVLMVQSTTRSEHGHTRDSSTAWFVVQLDAAAYSAGEPHSGAEYNHLPYC